MADGKKQADELVNAADRMTPDPPKHPGGRPLKFKTVAELEKAVEAYFASCWDYARDQFGNRIHDKENPEYTKSKPIYLLRQVKPYTISGLAVGLKTSRDILLDYEDRDEFSNTIKEAKQRCQAYAEEQLFMGKQAAGPIFNLKNNYDRWRDKTEVDQNVTADVQSGGKPIADPIAAGFADYLKGASLGDPGTNKAS